MKELFDYLYSCSVELIKSEGGIIISSKHLDKVELAKVQELCPDGFFVNPNVVPSAKTVLKCQAEGKDVPTATIGIFVGQDKDPMAHLIALGEKASS